MAEIYTGHQKKVVDMHNKPIKTDEDKARDESEAERKKNMVAGLREMAERIESGQLTLPTSLICVPMMGEEVPVIVLGEQLPTLFVEGLFHRIATKMAFGQ